MLDGVYRNIFKIRVKEARKRTGFTQEDVAEETGINNTTISKYENGLLEPSLDALGTLATFYDVSTDWLLGLGRAAGSLTASHNNEMTKAIEKEARRRIRKDKYIGIAENHGTAYIEQH